MQFPIAEQRLFQLIYFAEPYRVRIGYFSYVPEYIKTLLRMTQGY